MLLARRSAAFLPDFVVLQHAVYLTGTQRAEERKSSGPQGGFDHRREFSGRCVQSP